MRMNLLIISCLLINLTCCCTDPNCLECFDNICTKCVATNLYYLNQGICVKSSDIHCTSIDQSGNCLACEQDYLLTQNQLCIPGNEVINNCQNYEIIDSKTSCQSCLPNYRLTRQLCFRKLPNCQVYIPNRNRCLLCEDGYRLSGDQIVCSLTN